MSCSAAVLCSAPVLGPVTSLQTPAPPPARIHVAPDGNDADPGTETRPLATPRGARDAIRHLRAANAGRLPCAVEVLFHGGTYRLEETWTLGPEDSGSTESPITYAAAPGERPVLSGGSVLGPWRTAKLGEAEVWTAEVPEACAASSPEEPARFRELWIGGARATPAREPDSGFLRIEAVPGVPPETPWHEGKPYFRFEPSDERLWSSVRPGTDVVAFTRWIDNHLVVASIEPAERLVRFTRRALFLFDPLDIYYLEGQLELLDSPGEWALDRAGRTLHYLSHPGDRRSPPSRSLRA